MIAARSLLAVLPFALVACASAHAPDALTPKTEDTKAYRARYDGRYSGPCYSWVKSPFTGKTYCSSPWIEYSNLGAYAAPVAPAAAATDASAFANWDRRSADEKKAVLMAEGEKVYGAQCAACHQPTGQGLAGNFPPLAGDPVVNGGPVEEHIGVVLNGLSGKVINGVSYAAAMAPFGNLSDEQIASVITYERNSWGNAGGIVEPAQVAALRKR